MNKTTTIFASLLILSMGVFAQEEILEMNPAVDTIEPVQGPNRKHFVHPFMSFGLCIDAGETGAQVKQPRVDQFSLGFRYKRRVAEHFAWGWDLAYNVNDYSLKQNLIKTTPDSFLYDRQRMIFYNAQVGLYVRINYGKRGNTLGNYIDLAGYGDAVFAHTLFTKKRLNDKYNSVERTRLSGLGYFQRLNYGAQVRFGFKKIIFYGQYRLSDMFYKPENFAELPRIIAGIQFSLR
jgi:hypothetical protein